MTYLILSYLIWSCLVSSHLILSYLISSHIISSHLISSYLILSYLILSYLILSYLILSYLYPRPIETFDVEMDDLNHEDFTISTNPAGAGAAQATHHLQTQSCPGDVARCCQTLKDAFHKSSVFEPFQSAITIVAHAMGRRQVRAW